MPLSQHLVNMGVPRIASVAAGDGNTLVKVGSGRILSMAITTGNAIFVLRDGVAAGNGTPIGRYTGNGGGTTGPLPWRIDVKNGIYVQLESGASGEVVISYI